MRPDIAQRYRLPAEQLDSADQGCALDAFTRTNQHRSHYCVRRLVARTWSGKEMKLPVKKLLLGHPLEKVANSDAMADPASFGWFVAFAQNRQQHRDRTS